MSLHIAGVNYESFADAEGVSCVIFFSGCLHKCPECHSPQTHDFNYGEVVTDELIESINQEIDKRPFLSSIVLSGGDPMYSAKEILKVLDKLNITNKKLWCFSGFIYEGIQENEDMTNLLNKCDVLVDGLFEIEKRDISLQFRGSSNQRIIDVQESLKQNNVVLWKSR